MGDMCRIDAMEQYLLEVSEADPDWEEKVHSGMSVIFIFLQSKSGKITYNFYFSKTIIIVVALRI